MEINLKASFKLSAEGFGMSDKSCVKFQEKMHLLTTLRRNFKCSKVDEIMTTAHQERHRLIGMSFAYLDRLGSKRSRHQTQVFDIKAKYFLR